MKVEGAVRLTYAQASTQEARRNTVSVSLDKKIKL